MAYDVERKPGAWVNEQANKRSRSFLLLVFAMLGAVGLATLAWFTGQHFVAIVLYVVTALLAVATYDTLELAAPWIRGGAAEASVGEELNGLIRDGYVVMHDVLWGGSGNLDHVVSGPNGVFLVETKAGGYEDWQLGRVKHVAKLLHDELGCWVTPVICSGVRKKTFRHSRVLITGRGRVAEAIRSDGGGRPVDPERLRRWADSLD